MIGGAIERLRAAFRHAPDYGGQSPYDENGGGGGGRAVAEEDEPERREGPLIELSGLGVVFGKQRVLRDITLEVDAGETIALIGESGCGKTVLLKSIIGLIRPTEGVVTFDGQDMSKIPERELPEQRIRFGFLFQNAALFDSLTVGQNVAFPLRQHRRMSLEKMRERVVSLLAEVGLPEQVVSKRPAELSGGMRKRVGLARALVLEPEVMLYDEPTTGLDPIMSDVINELILRTRRRHPVTSLIVTHNMQTVRKVADRVIMIQPVSRLDEDEPQILFDGTADELEKADDPRVRQFVRGEAGERLQELGVGDDVSSDH